MKAVVNEDRCIGSGSCGATCPAVFKGIDGVSHAKVDVVPPGEKARPRKGADVRPAGTFSFGE